MYVLIVDDDASIRRAFETFLHRKGHRTCWASSGEGALEQMRLERPGLVILDMMLDPGMSGWDVMRKKILDPDIRSIPVIICSGLPSIRQTPEDDPTTGALLVLSKPPDLHQLEEIIRVLESKTSAASSDP